MHAVGTWRHHSAAATSPEVATHPRLPISPAPRALVALLAIVSTAGCIGERPTALAPTPAGDGPVVRWDLTERPFPELPFPNDVATRIDPSSRTGRRLDISVTAPTKVERRVRKRINGLDGFGVLSPITVPFDAALDLENIRARHVDDRDLANDTMLLIRLGDGDACEQDRLVPLDLGNGHYPLILDRPCQYQYHLWVDDFICDPPPPCEGDDPRWTASNTLFETVDEDLDGDGVLDPYEDTDFDGHLDRPNTWSREDRGSADADDLITFYERETNTLVAWPVVPLEENARYAVVLTRHMLGAAGEPIRSPFPAVTPADHAEPLAQLAELLPCHGLSVDDVAFAWVFTTGTPTRDLIDIREGLYGSGPLAALGAVDVTHMRPKPARDPNPDGTLPEEPFVLPNELLLPVMQILAGEILQTPGAGQQAADDAVHVDYWVAGEVETPNLMIDKDGRATPLYPDDQDEIFALDVGRGEVTFEPGMIPFACAIPVETETHRPPFPVVLYGHGYSGATFEILGFAGRYARAGFALCAIEAPAHGVVIPESEEEIAGLLDYFLPTLGLEAFYESYALGRVRDVDNSGDIGERDNGTDFWLADAFHTRDMVRQLVIDELAFIRALRAVDGVRTFAEADTDLDGTPDLLADFNGDGVPDIGGWEDLDGDGTWDADEPENPFYAWGQSLGGIATGVLAAVEPVVRAAAPVSAAGGLVHVATRSTNLGVPEAILLPLLGPFVTFAPHRDEAGEPDGRVDVGFLVPNVNEPVRPVFHVSDRIEPGDRLLVQNLKTGQEVRAFANEALELRVGIQADALRTGDKRQHMGLTDETALPVDVGPGARTAAGLGDPLRVIVLDGWDGPPKEVIDAVSVPFTYQGVTALPGTPLFALHEGLGYTRNSPNFRRLLGLAQTIMEPGDPAAYGRYIHQSPLEFPYETGAVADARAAGRMTHVLQTHTVGDSDVPMSTGLTFARAAGLIDWRTVNPETGRTDMELLIDTWVVEGVERTMRYAQRKEPMNFCPPAPWSEWSCPPVRLGEEERYRAFFDEEGGCLVDLGDCAGACPDGEACHYDDVCVPCAAACADMADFPVEGVLLDVEDYDLGSDRLVLPEYHLPGGPLRITRDLPGGVFALRIPYMDRYGSHGVPPSIPERAFDINGFEVNQILWFLASDGQQIVDDPCLASGDCPFFPWNAE